MILLVDADSMIFASCYRKKQHPDDNPFYENLSDAIHKFDETYQKIVNDIEQLYVVDSVLTFNGSRGNFRKHLTKKYKANRINQPKPPLLRNNVMIVSIDKDYKQFPALIYNYGYKHKCVYDISEEEARYNFYEQMIAGDAADNVNYFKGKGVAFSKKYYEGCLTEYQYRRKLFELFKSQYKSKAREKYIQCYNLLKLKIL